MDNSLAYLKGSVWRIWNDYWSELGEKVPPLAFLRGGADTDGFFVSAVSDYEMLDFIAFANNSQEVEFVKEGDWPLDNGVWFGWWSVVLARPKVLTKRPDRRGGRK
jgi:hypothetical protein